MAMVDVDDSSLQLYARMRTASRQTGSTTTSKTCFVHLWTDERRVHVISDVSKWDVKLYSHITCHFGDNKYTNIRTVLSTDVYLVLFRHILSFMNRALCVICYYVYCVHYRCVMPRLHHRNLLRATRCAQHATCCAQQASSCAGVNAALVVQ